MDATEDIIARIVIAAAEIIATPGIFKRVWKYFYVVVCNDVHESTAAISNNTCSNFLLCCKLMWNKSFSIIIAFGVFSVPMWRDNLNMHFCDFHHLRMVCDPMFHYNFYSYLSPLTTLSILLINIWTPCMWILFRIFFFIIIISPPIFARSLTPSCSKFSMFGSCVRSSGRIRNRTQRGDFFSNSSKWNYWNLYM